MSNTTNLIFKGDTLGKGVVVGDIHSEGEVFAHLIQDDLQDGVFTILGEYKDADGKSLKPIRKPMTLEALAQLQSALGVTETSIDKLLPALKKAGAKHVLDSDAEFEITSWTLQVKE